MTFRNYGPGLAAIAGVIVMVVLLWLNGSSPTTQPDVAVDSAGSEIESMRGFDGLAQEIFDTTVRIRNRQGTGSGSVVADLGDKYEIESNHHVAERRGTRNVIDVWEGGDLFASLPQVTQQSWFEDGKSKDIAVLHIPKDQLRGELAVVPTAPQGFSKRLKAGDQVFMVGCSDGRWPRARCGNILKIDRGLIYYDPKSIGGDSGSGVYYFDEQTQQWLCVGRTAWAIREGNRWVGLAMTSDRVRAIREGRVSTGWKLPTGAKPLDEIDFDGVEKVGFKSSLPNDAVRLDLMRVQKPRLSGEDPEPLDVGFCRPRKPSADSPKNIREGIGAGVASFSWWIGFTIAMGAVTVLVLVAGGVKWFSSKS